MLSALTHPNNKHNMLTLSIAILLAVRCQHKQATLQLLNTTYHALTEQQSKTLLNRIIYLLEPYERDWMKSLA
jgi:hypothetical protein